MRTRNAAAKEVPLNAPYEPSSDMRQLAKTLRDMYQALIAEKFSEQQALVIIGQVIAAGVQGHQK